MNEGNGSIEVCAVLVAGSLERTATFILSSESGSATSPADYTDIQVDLAFDSSTRRACADIPIIDDDTVEEQENFTIIVSGDDPDIDFGPATSVVTIVDNDIVVIGFEMETYRGDEGTTVEVCAVVIDGALERSTAVEVFTADLTAEGNTALELN